MGEPVSLIGLAIAVVLAGERIHDKYNTRRTAREKAEADRLAALDKLRFDADFLAAKNKVAALAEGHAKCQEDSRKLEAKVGDLERRLEAKAAMLAAQDMRDKRDLEAKIDAKLKE